MKPEEEQQTDKPIADESTKQAPGKDKSPQFEKPKIPARKRPRRLDKNSPEYLLTNPKSKLASINLKSIISAELFGTVFSDAERETLLKLLPDVDRETSSTGSSGITTNPSLFKYNHYFEECCAIFQDNLSNGAYQNSFREDDFVPNLSQDYPASQELLSQPQSKQGKLSSNNSIGICIEPTERHLLMTLEGLVTADYLRRSDTISISRRHRTVTCKVEEILSDGKLRMSRFHRGNDEMFEVSCLRDILSQFSYNSGNNLYLQDKVQIMRGDKLVGDFVELLERRA